MNRVQTDEGIAATRQRFPPKMETEILESGGRLMSLTPEQEVSQTYTTLSVSDKLKPSVITEVS